MEHSNEYGFPSSPIPFRNHTALLLSAALPYLHPSYRHPIELALKFLEFTETLRLFREFPTPDKSNMFFPKDSHASTGNSGFFGLINTYVTDLEGLLISLSSVCTGDEKEVIGMFLNLIRAKNFYDTYGELLTSQLTDPNSLAGLFSGLGNLGNNFSGDGDPLSEKKIPDTNPANAPASVPNLSGMLNDEQKETLELLKSLFSNE